MYSDYCNVTLIFLHRVSKFRDDREIVRQSAMEAIDIMAKTSKETQNNLFPTLLHSLDDPADYALETVAQGTYDSRGNMKTSTHLHSRTCKSCFYIRVCVCDEWQRSCASVYYRVSRVIPPLTYHTDHFNQTWQPGSGRTSRWRNHRAFIQRPWLWTSKAHGGGYI